MAGQEIYLGKMIESLQSDIATVVSTLQAHTIALGNINNTVAQGVTKLNVKSSDVVKGSFTNGEKSKAGTTTATYYPFYSAKAICDGSICIKCTAHRTTTSDMMVYVKVGTTYYTYNMTTANADEAASIPNIIIADGDVFEIGIHLKNSGITGTIRANSIKVAYDLVDIVNDGAVIVATLP